MAAKKTSTTKATTKGERGMTALDAAAKVLGESKAPLASKAMIEAMASKKYWSSPNGKTPHATLYAAILREIRVKGNESRFTKTGAGHFTLKGKKASKKTKA